MPQNTQLHFDIIKNYEGFLLLELEWNALYEKNPAHFLTDSFYWCKNNINETNKDNLFIITGRMDDKLVLVFPFVLKRRFLFLTCAEPLANISTEYSAFIIDAVINSDDYIKQCWIFLKKNINCDIIRLPSLHTHSTLYEVATNSTWNISQTRTIGSTIHLKKFTTWDDYKKSLGIHQTHDLARRQRRLHEQGVATLQFETDAQERITALEWLLKTKKEWVKKRTINNRWIHTEYYKNFLFKIQNDEHLSPSILISTLKLNDEIIAANLARKGNTSLETVMSSYNPAFHKYSPSHLLMEHIIHHAFDMGLNLDLRIGEENYKNHWKPQQYGIAHLMIAHSVLGLPFIWLRNLYTRIQNKNEL